MENSILRWSTVCVVSEEDYQTLLTLCKNEFTDIRFKAVYYAQQWYWIQALLEHERGCGWGQRTGEREPEIRQYADAMKASLERKRKFKNNLFSC